MDTRTEGLLNTPTTVERELFHIFGGLVFPIAALSLPRMVLLTFLGVVTLIFISFELLRLRVPGINRRFVSYFKPLLRGEEVSRLTGASYLLIASSISFLAFPRDIAVLALAFLALGNPVATLVGERIGKTKLGGKSLEGDGACFITCLATGLAFHYAGLGIPWLAIVAGSAAATLMEAIPLPLNDNLTIPLFAGLVMRFTWW